MPAHVIGGNAKAKASLAVIVRNDSGIGFTGMVDVAVVASTDGVLDAGDVALAHSDKPLKLKVAQSKAVKLRVSLASLPAGQYTLLGSATTANLTASTAGPAVSVETPFVHLIGTGAVTPATVLTPGRRTTLPVPLRNDGNVATSNVPATFTLIFSTDDTEAGGVYTMTLAGKVSLKPGVAKPQKLATTIPAGSVAAGMYVLLVKLSADLNDTNGQIVAQIPATVV